ncbi:hypothetical protein BN946_scf184828.g9 [Trametes cinnabarina]|uniref:N-acetyltransferase domain-containing protein n=1 Tax=Pycnoporus cinnabarinus TaxID=5643 RepID=A0A060SR17_PYCCI|nr:hypothetical protein BN946_scf184828.g9 [Trametes cinnabarina]
MSATVREVTSPSEAELDGYVKLLAEAFHYRFFAGGLGGDESLQEPMMHAHIAAALVNGEGEVHVAELPQVGPVGAAVWFGPGHKFLDTDAQRNAGWNQLMERLPTQYREWWTTFLKQYDELVDKTVGANVKLSGYHLQLIGVHPDHQKKGVGSTLMKYAESKAHAARVPTLLETVGSMNVQIYKSLGYEVAGSGPISVPPPSPPDATFEMFTFIKHTEAEDFKN